MSSDVMFVLFDASSVGLFHECSSLPKKIYLFIYLFIHKTNLIFLKVLYKSKFFIKKLI